jgi:predicted nucleic acid-binding protein
MRALIDTDVILDVLLARPQFVADAMAIWQANETGTFEGYISAITPVNIFYIARKLKGGESALQAVTEVLDTWHVCPIDATILGAALKLSLKDYEDAVQHATASANHLEMIVTRNVEDYREATLQILTPGDFLAHLRSK